MNEANRQAPFPITNIAQVCVIVPEISNATNHRHVIENLKRAHGLPRIHLCGRAVYLTDSVKAWLEKHVVCGR